MSLSDCHCEHLEGARQSLGNLVASASPRNDSYESLNLGKNIVANSPYAVNLTEA